MDCPHFLKQLDAVFPGSEDHEDPGVREAVAHLSECESCAREFQARGEFDRQIAVRIRDVPVPPEARERLLQQLSRTNPGPSPASTESGSRRPKRLRLWKTLAPIAAVLVVGLIFYMRRDTESHLTMTQVQDSVAKQFADVTFNQYDELPDFTGGFDAAIDDGRWNRVTNSNPRGVDLDEDGKQDAAVYWMNSPVQGVLLVLSPDLVDDPPSSPSPRGPARLYNPVRVAWLPRDSKKVHICVLKRDGDDSDLDRLLRYVIDAMTA